MRYVGIALVTDTFVPQVDGVTTVTRWWRWRRRLDVSDGIAPVLRVGRLAPKQNLPRLESQLPWVRRVGLLERNAPSDLCAAVDVAGGEPHAHLLIA